MHEPNIYYDNDLKIDVAKITPGGYYITQNSMAIVSIMAASVIICAHDLQTGVGGMLHILEKEHYPNLSWPTRLAMSTTARKAIIQLGKNLAACGAIRKNIDVKVFFGKCGNGVKVTDIPDTIAQLKTIAPNIKSNVLTSSANKVYYFPENGRVWVKKIVALPNATVGNREAEYISRLR